MSQDPLVSSAQNLFRGRIFWISLIATYILSTGLKSGRAWIMGSSFIPMIALAALLLVPDSVKHSKILKVSVVTLMFSNPLILTFGRSVQPDIAQAFYSTLALYYAIKSFTFKQGTVVPNMSHILRALLVLAISFTIRENAGVIFVILLFMIVVSIRYRLWRFKKLIILLCTLTILFALLCVVMRPIGLMIPPVESYDLLSYVKRFYVVCSPEALNPLIPINIILLPAIWWFTSHREKDYEVSALYFVAAIMFILTYIFSLTSFASFYNISRYMLFMVPTLITTSLTALYALLSLGYAYILTIPAAFVILWANYELTLNGFPVYRAIPYELGLRDTFSIILTSFLGICLILAVHNARITSLKIKILKKSRRKFNARALAFLAILCIAVSLNIYFSHILAFSYSKYAQNYDLTNAEYLDIGEQNVMVSNFYYYARCYVPDNIFSDGILLSIPIEEQEFLQLIHVLPNNAYLVLTDDPRLAWYEYGNTYIMDYICRNFSSSNIHTNVIFLGSTVLPKGKVILYKVMSPIIWKMNGTSLKINEITIIPAHNDNKKDVQMRISIWSNENEDVIIIVNTYRFSKLLKANLAPGLNRLKFNFSYRLPDGRTYGSQVQSWSEIIIIDSKGNIAFHKHIAAFVMRRGEFLMYAWTLFLTFILTLYLCLNGVKPGS